MPEHLGAVPKPDEFYVGYLPKAPPGPARIAWWSSVAVLALGAVVAGLLAAAQSGAVRSAWPDESVELVGLLEAAPYPVLHVPAKGGEPAQAVLLCDAGKFGLLDPRDYCGPDLAASRLSDAAFARRVEALKARSGQVVSLRGTILRREGRMALELSGGEAGLPPPQAPGAPALATMTLTTEQLGQATLRGEIVDPKCFFGAMKPGSGQTHKACAARCVSGGIAPVLVVRTSAGEWGCYTLVDTAGRPVNKAVLGLVGEPVEVSGAVSRRGGLLLLSIDPALIRRL